MFLRHFLEDKGTAIHEAVTVDCLLTFEKPVQTAWLICRYLARGEVKCPTTHGLLPDQVSDLDGELQKGRTLEDR